MLYIILALVILNIIISLTQERRIVKKIIARFGRARRIKKSIPEIPVLEGEDAKKFIERMEFAHSNPVSEEEYKEAKEIYNKIEDNQEKV